MNDTALRDALSDERINFYGRHYLDKDGPDVIAFARCIAYAALESPPAQAEPTDGLLSLDELKLRLGALNADELRGLVVTLTIQRRLDWKYGVPAAAAPAQAQPEPALLHRLAQEVRTIAVQAEHPKLGVHLSHCNFGEYAGVCKYGANDCPALTDGWSWFGAYLQRAENIIDRAQAPDDAVFMGHAKAVAQAAPAEPFASLRAAFAKIYPNDDAMLELSEHNRDFNVEALGARHHWSAFQHGARAAAPTAPERPTMLSELLKDWSEARAVDGIKHPECMRMVQVGDRMLDALQRFAPPEQPEARLNEDGTLDEVVGIGAFHLEQMADNHWWMEIENSAGRIAVWLITDGGKIVATYEVEPAAPAQSVKGERCAR